MARLEREPMAKSYFIKDGYRINPRPVAFDDSIDASRTYQREVYQFAAACAKRFGARRVLDITRSPTVALTMPLEAGSSRTWSRRGLSSAAPSI
jgi:hypothetical protein